MDHFIDVGFPETSPPRLALRNTCRIMCGSGTPVRTQTNPKWCFGGGSEEANKQKSIVLD
jgi:hypothetical protein